MKKLFIIMFLFAALTLNAQIDTPPTGTNFKTVPTYTFKWYTTDSTLWMYKGSTYGWTNISKSFDSLRYYRLLNNHESLSTLQERSYHSLIDTPNLDLKANIASPTFTGIVTTPALNIPTSATVNYYWRCTNAATGAGSWQAVTASQLYKGTIDGDDGVPTVGGSALIDGTGTAGWFYVCIDAGTYDYGNPNGNSITLALNDQIHYNGSIWQKVPAGSSQWITTGSDIYYNSGNVGIGTVTPSSYAGYSALTLNNATNGGIIDFKQGDTRLGTIVQSTGSLQLRTVTALDLGLGTSNAINLTIRGSNGLVGIGTTTPDYNLDIYDALVAQIRIKGAYASGATDANLILEKPSTSRGAGTFFVTSDAGMDQWFFGLPYNGGSAQTSLTWGYHASQPHYIANAKMTLTTAGALTVTSTVTATGGNSTQWNTAYTHSQIAGGNSVHVSTDENTQWDAAYTHSQIAGGTGVHISGTERTNWGTAYTHSQDNTQAHSDYLINNGNDATTGSLTATNFILSSDRRLKKNISPIKKAFNIKFVQFNLKSDPDQLRYGVIAQDVEKYYPELVRTDSEGTKSVAYIDLLIGKIHELEQRIEALEKTNALNENKLNFLLNER